MSPNAVTGTQRSPDQHNDTVTGLTAQGAEILDWQVGTVWIGLTLSRHPNLQEIFSVYIGNERENHTEEKEKEITAKRLSLLRIKKQNCNCLS